MTFRHKGDDVMIPMQNTRIEVDAVTAGRAAVLDGLGLMVLPLNEIEDNLESGALVEISSQLALPSFGSYAVWPDSGPQKNLTRRLIDFPVEHR